MNADLSSTSPSPSPSRHSVLLADHQSAIPVDLDLLRRLLPRALATVLAEPAGPASDDLPSLTEIEITLLSDEEIARQHGAFLNDPSPTDVITFTHGELLLSADTAAREARHRGWATERELLLYAIHGLLHLRGHDDLDPAGRERMHAAQERILAELWAE